MHYATPKRRIDLDDTGMVWRVARGEASVVVEPAPGSDLPRASQTLLRVPQGGYVFGISSQIMPEQVQVFVETSPDAQLIPMMSEDFIATCRAKPGKREQAAVARGTATRQPPQSQDPAAGRQQNAQARFKFPVAQEHEGIRRHRALVPHGQGQVSLWRGHGRRTYGQQQLPSADRQHVGGTDRKRTPGLRQDRRPCPHRPVF